MGRLGKVGLGMELVTADRELEIVLLRVLGTVGKGSARRGEAGSGKG